MPRLTASQHRAPYRPEQEVRFRNKALFARTPARTDWCVSQSPQAVPAEDWKDLSLQNWTQYLQALSADHTHTKPVRLKIQTALSSLAYYPVTSLHHLIYNLESTHLQYRPSWIPNHTFFFHILPSLK